MRKLLVSTCALIGLIAILAGFTPARAETALTIEIVVSPNTLVLASEGSWVTVHTNIAYGAVATSTLELDGIAVAWTKVDNKGYLVAKFNLDDVKNIVAPPEVELTLSGVCKDGTPFEGSDVVTVIAGPKG